MTLARIALGALVALLGGWALLQRHRRVVLEREQAIRAHVFQGRVAFGN